jgi:hypothetical protein
LSTAFAILIAGSGGPERGADASRRGSIQAFDRPSI